MKKIVVAAVISAAVIGGLVALGSKFLDIEFCDGCDGCKGCNGCD